MNCITPSSRLIDLNIGERAIVKGYDPGEPAYRMKLLALGLTRNVPFQVIKAAPLGDPIEIEVRGYRLSLRKQEASAIQVERATPKSPHDCSCK
jgi:Fe2+ transport system protein FeoA